MQIIKKQSFKLKQIFQKNFIVSRWRLIHRKNSYGHVRNYTIGDVLVIINFKDIMFYILWVGIHLECLLKMQQNKTIWIQKWTEKNTKHENSIKTGSSIDWDREISTCNKDYYNTNKHFSWNYLKKLVYRKKIMSIGISR